MTNEYYDAVISYKSAMAQAKELLSSGIITPGEFSVIETKMSEKYGINSCSIYRDNDWINTPFRGNMSPERMVV